jgi:hypothetical protein
MMRLFLSFLPLLYSISLNAQVSYALRVETGSLLFQYTTVDVDPGPNWKGHSLNEKQNGFAFDIINSISINKKLLVGVGVGYLNFEGIHGYSLYGDLQYVPMKTRLSPLISLKVGTNHIWNQYENGQGSAIGELGVGIHYQVRSIRVYLTSGVMITQQTFLVPIRLGVRLKG